MSRKSGTVDDKQPKWRAPVSMLAANLRHQERAETTWDCALLGVATLLPVILNISRLGFYADDWGNIGRFESNGDTTIADYFRRLYALPGTRGRPAMDLYLAVQFRLFGIHSLAYHVLNVLVLFSAALLFYFSLRFVLRQRFVAFLVPLIFVLLPNYSSAKLVACTSMIGLSLAFFFLNLYSLLKATSKTMLGLAWTCVSVAAVLASGLLYEMLLPLFVVNLLVVSAVQLRKTAEERLGIRSLALLLLTNAGALLSVVIFKIRTATRPHGVASARSVLTDALVVHFYKLGLRLPLVATKVVLIYGNAALSAMALLFGVFVFSYCLRLQRRTGDSETSANAGLRLVAFGLLIFAFAATIFVAAGGATGFTATGFENRTAIGISLGMAFIFSGMSVWLGSVVKTHRVFLVSLLIALLCICELLATSSIGSFWAAAAERQELVLNSIRQDIPALPPHSALILDGVCPYIGPGIVFEGHQDMGGALQMLYRDPTLRGDVVGPGLQVHQGGIETSIYGRNRYYLYGTVKVYDFRRRKAWDLQDVKAAVQYFGMLGPSHSFCPEGEPGEGVPIF